MQTILIVTFVAAAAAAAATPARADDTASVRVSYADLDLQTRPGVETLNGRIKAAAARLCPPGGSPLTRYSAVRCRKAARATAHGPMTLAVAEARARDIQDGN